ncbi:MAG: T9SS type A sorting domain-containing protein [Bacteroidota bacterium]
MPRRFLVFAVLASLGLAAAFWLWPSGPAAPPAPIESDEPGPDMRPAEWAADQRLFPVWQADPAAMREALDAAQALRAEARGGPFGAWEQAGPTNVGGRVSDIEFAPSAPDVVYASPATGGVFRSEDAGFTWAPIFDDQAVLTVGDLAVHPSDPNTVWVGTGEANGSHNNFAGGGIYKTSDAGATWDFLGLGESYSVGRIRIDPTDPDRVFVAALGAYFGKNEQRGVFRSEDGGANWERVLFLSDSTAVIDLAMRPDDPDVLFASTWSRIRRPTGSNLSGPTSGLWRSTDGGDTWDELGAANGLPNPDVTDVGRIGLDICRDVPDTIYAYYTDGSQYLGLFRSDDGGDTWTDEDPSGEIGFNTSGFEWWMGQVRVAPDDPDDVFVLSTPLIRRSGSFWNAEFGFEVLHVDHHAMAFKPDDPDVVLSGNDGGIDRSTDGGASWTPVNGLAITHFYEIGLDAQNPERLYGGTQDNSTNRTLTGALDDWDVIYFGDGFYTIVDPTDADVIYAESQFGGLGKSTDGGFSFNDATSGIDFNEPRNWSTPVIMDPNDNLTLYYGTNYVYRTVNGADSWTKISPQLAGNQPRINTISTIGVSPADSDVVWAGTADGKLWVTTDGDDTWVEVTQPNLPERWVTRVIPDPLLPETAYATFSGLKWYEPVPHVFRTDDAGQTWTDISGTLPDAPVNALAVDPVDTDVLYVGSDVGAFVSLDRGATWGALGTGLPAVSVYDLKVHPTERFLAAGTHGRSMWRLDLSNVTVATEEEAGPLGFALGAAYPNPFAESTTLSYRLDAAAQVTVEVFDVRGRRVATLADAEQAAGEHRVTWDAAGAATGTYLVRLSADGQQQTQSVTLAR